MPGLEAVLVGDAGPQVDHGFAADLHTQRGAAFLRVVEQLGEGLLHRLELQVEIAVDVHGDSCSWWLIASGSGHAAHGAPYHCAAP
ncbi:hypothetical protein D3C81_1548270 [compost metagenome]